MLSTDEPREVVGQPEWIALLRPVGECHLGPLRRRSKVMAWHAIFEFVRFIPPQKLPWTETYGKRLMVRADGSWTVAEIELVRRFRKAGWQAGWVDTYGRVPRKWAKWIVKPESLPLPLCTIYEAITNFVDPKGAGRPDIIAWRDGTLAKAVFVESKGMKETTRKKQVKWFREANHAGVSLDQLAIARWRELKE